MTTREELDEALEALLVLYAAEGVTALALLLDEDRLTVRCQREEDVRPMCQKVADQYWRGAGETIN